jgi:hypothetical protein
VAMRAHPPETALNRGEINMRAVQLTAYGNPVGALNPNPKITEA